MSWWSKRQLARDRRRMRAYVMAEPEERERIYHGWRYDETMNGMWIGKRRQAPPVLIVANEDEWDWYNTELSERLPFDGGDTGYFIWFARDIGGSLPPFDHAKTWFWKAPNEGVSAPPVNGG